MVNNPWAYRQAPKTDGMVDFVYLGKLIFGLFKKKRKGRAEKDRTVSRDKLIAIFKEDELLTEKLLVDQLHIPIEYHGLFFDFCEADGIPVAMLAADQRFVLLDRLVVESQFFLRMLKEVGALKN